MIGKPRKKGIDIYFPEGASLAEDYGKFMKEYRKSFHTSGSGIFESKKAKKIKKGLFDI